MTTAQLIAAEFTARLGSILTCREWSAMLKRNAAEPCPSVCHSHDFCDANEPMAEAFHIITGRDIDTQSETDAALWSDAWSIAKASWRNEQ